jgi:glycosyltransferase involved in cell wall biosynthesis
MHWFYGQLDTVFVNSEEYRQSWIDRGLDPGKIRIFPRGLDTELFTRRDASTRFGRNLARVTAKCACSMSVEYHERKDLDILANAYRDCAEGLPVQLFVVGHGLIVRRSLKLCPTQFSPAILRALNLPCPCVG